MKAPHELSVTVRPENGADGAPSFRVTGQSVNADGEVREFDHVAASPDKAWTLAILETEVAFGRAEPDVIDRELAR